MATPNYKPGGFTNLGATPSYSSLSNKTGSVGYTPQTSGMISNTPTPQNTWQNTLSDVMSSRGQTGAVKKVVDSNGNEIHFDTVGSSKLTDKPIKQGNNTGLISNKKTDSSVTQPPQTFNVLDPKTGLYSSGSNINPTPLTDMPQQPQPNPVADTPTYSGLVGDTANTAKGNIPIGQSAKDIMTNYGQQIADVGQQGANYQAGSLTTGTTPVGEGNAAINAAATAAKQTALAQGGQMALTGTGQQLTAQNQAQTGLLGTAESVKGTPTAQGQTTYNPLTNTFSGGSYPDNLNTVVQAIKSGNMGYTNGVNSLSSLSPTAKADVLKALGTGFDTVSSDANAATKGSNITTMGTAQTNAQATSLGNLTQQANTLAASRASVANLANITLNTIAQNNSLNPSNINAVNGVIQTIAKNTSNPQYQNLMNQITDIVSTYGSILNPTGNTDTTRATASNMVNSLANGSTLQDVISSLDSQAQAKISGIQSTASNISSGTNVNPSSSLISSNTYTANGTTYVKGTDGLYYPK